MVLELWIAEHYEATLLIAINQLCLLSVLIHYQDISEIYQLDRACEHLKREMENVNKQMEKADKYMQDIMKCQNLWHQRTLPCLGIAKFVHKQIGDLTLEITHKRASEPTQDLEFHLNQFMERANEQLLKDLERRLGDVTIWRDGKSLSEEARKQIEKALKDCEHDLTEM